MMPANHFNPTPSAAATSPTPFRAAGAVAAPYSRLCLGARRWRWCWCCWAAGSGPAWRSIGCSSRRGPLRVALLVAAGGRAALGPLSLDLCGGPSFIWPTQPGAAGRTALLEPARKPAHRRRTGRSARACPAVQSPDAGAHVHEAEHGTRELAAWASIFDRRPLLRAPSALAVLLVASVIAFAVAASESALGIWARRSFLLSSELWPRKTHLTVEGFNEAGRMKIARGSDVDLVVKADAAPPARRSGDRRSALPTPATVPAVATG